MDREKLHTGSLYFSGQSYIALKGTIIEQSPAFAVMMIREDENLHGAYATNFVDDHIKLQLSCFLPIFIK